MEIQIMKKDRRKNRNSYQKTQEKKAPSKDELKIKI